MTNQQKMEEAIQKWRDTLATMVGGEYTQFAHNCARRLGGFAETIEMGFDTPAHLDGINYADLRMHEDFFRAAALTAHRSAMQNDVVAILGVRA